MENVTLHMYCEPSSAPLHRTRQQGRWTSLFLSHNTGRAFKQMHTFNNVSSSIIQVIISTYIMNTRSRSIQISTSTK